jgi:diguanylate cyclase (GGDEF)-like protein
MILIGYVDFITGNELSLSAFYLLPVSLVALNAGKPMGILVAVISACGETMVQILWGGFYYSSVLIHFWNMGILMALYIVIAVLVSSLSAAYQRERGLARRDFLTGIHNWQSFVELAEREVERAKRFKTNLTLAYIDCDNFKMVNDTLGHHTGDMVLRNVASIIGEHIRVADILARLGGDEFVVLFTDARPDGAELAMSNIRSLLLEDMKNNNWGVTFSIGMVSFVNPPRSVESMIKMADIMMYDVKKSTRNAIKHEVLQD